MRGYQQKIVITSLLLLLSCGAHADLLGVEDAALLTNAIKQLTELQEQVKLMENVYNTAKSQLDSLKALKEANIGNYGLGSLDNGLDALKGWQSSADNWQDALKNISGGNPTRYAELVKSYEASHPYLSDTEYAASASPERLHQYQQKKALNKAVSVQTTYAFNDINTRLKSIHTLSQQIDKTANTKSAMDLNSRLITELAYIEVMNLKLQTLISQQMAQAGADELAEDNEMIRFNTPHHAGQK